MKIYRAMCEEEYLKTLKDKVPHFRNRYKWFSTNLDFIFNRVLDGNFNNSKYKQNRYNYILEFECNEQQADWINSNEIQFDRRKNPTIKLIREIKMTKIHERKIINPNNLVNKIYDCFCDADDNIGAKEFSIILNDYDGFNVYSVKEAVVTEQDGQVLTRLRNEIADYKLKRTNQLKVSKELLAIAENEELMQELLKLREQINAGNIEFNIILRYIII